MRKLSKKHKAIIFFGLFIVAVYFCVPSINYTSCLAMERFRNTSFEGVVIRKCLDKSAHSTPIAELKTYNDSLEQIYLFGDYSGLLDRITSGDSLKKRKGTNEVLKKLDGAYVRFGYADFKCDSVKLKKEEYLTGLYDLIGTIPKQADDKDR